MPDATDAAPAPAPGLKVARTFGGVPVYVGRTWFLIAGSITVGLRPAVEQRRPDLGARAYVVAAVFAVLLLRLRPGARGSRTRWSPARFGCRSPRSSLRPLGRPHRDRRGADAGPGRSASSRSSGRPPTLRARRRSAGSWPTGAADGRAGAARRCGSVLDQPLRGALQPAARPAAGRRAACSSRCLGDHRQPRPRHASPPGGAAAASPCSSLALGRSCCRSCRATSRACSSSSGPASSAPSSGPGRRTRIRAGRARGALAAIPIALRTGAGPARVPAADRRGRLGRCAPAAHGGTAMVVRRRRRPAAGPGRRRRPAAASPRRRAPAPVVGRRPRGSPPGGSSTPTRERPVTTWSSAIQALQVDAVPVRTPSPAGSRASCLVDDLEAALSRRASART